MYIALDIANSTLPQSGVALGCAAVLFSASCIASTKTRGALAVLALVTLLLGMLLLPLTTPAPMGDYHDFIENGRADFEPRFVTATQFQFHLGSVIVREIDAILGHPKAERTFKVLAVVASALSVAGLLGLGFWAKWAPRVTRYIALTVALPIFLLFFGYHEFGHLPMALIAPAMPLVLIGIEEGRWRLVAVGSGMLGVGAALHGFGLTGLGFALLVLVLALTLFRDPATSPLKRSDRLWAAVQALGAGLLGWLVWIAFYAVGLGIDVSAGHAAFRAFRPTFTAVLADHRIIQPVFSRQVLTVLPYELGAVGAAVLLLVPSGASRLRGIVVVACIPMLAFLVWFLPLQGIGNDTDNLTVVFPAYFAVAWLISASRRRTLVAGGVLLLGHFALLRILTTGQFVYSQLP